MLKLEVLIPLLKEIRKAKNGISAFELSKKLNKLEPTIRYNLKQCIKDGLVRQQNNLFFPANDILVNNGLIVVYVPSRKEYLFMGCKYLDMGCPCDGTECKMLEELYILKKQLDKLFSKNLCLPENEEKKKK